MILLVDNYDSFTWNLAQYLGELGAELVVRRNDKITLDEVFLLNPAAIVISPGPKTPHDAGISLELIERCGPSIPVLGVCLGHQAIAAVYGGSVIRAPMPMHGKTSRIVHGGSGLFAGIPSPLEVMRYHSLTVEPASLPEELEVLAWSEDDQTEIHALKHRSHPVWGLQFHPESIMTQCGRDILRNFLGAVG